jgi:hypothetical protein
MRRQLITIARPRQGARAFALLIGGQAPYQTHLSLGVLTGG